MAKHYLTFEEERKLHDAMKSFVTTDKDGFVVYPENRSEDEQAKVVSEQLGFHVTASNLARFRAMFGPKRRSTVFRGGNHNPEHMARMRKLAMEAKIAKGQIKANGHAPAEPSEMSALISEIRALTAAVRELVEVWT